MVHSFAGDDPLACRDHVRAALGQAKRRGPRWSPTAKQLATIRRIDERPADDPNDIRLIELIDGGGR